jgi:glycosyltransferase involved in cell wall biosynthesis
MKRVASPRVSCLMPVYNGQSYVEEAVKSIISQSFQDWEMIVVNDGSNDNTQEILEQLAAIDGRIRLISQNNSGIVGALNKGLAMCEGEFIARMDADDISIADRFEYQVQYLTSNQSCVVVGGVAISSEAGGSIGDNVTGGRHKTTNLDRFPPTIAVAMHPLIMVRRVALLSIGGYSNRYPHAEDYDLFIRLSALGSIDNPDKALLYYRRHSDAVSVKNLELQEHSAAIAEVDAIKKFNGRSINSSIFDAYVRLRIWRRYIYSDPSKADQLAKGAARDFLFLVSSCLVSREPIRLIAIFSVNFIRWGGSKVKRSVGSIQNRKRPILDVAA